MIGTSLNQYRITARIGAGGMCEFIPRLSWGLVVYENKSRKIPRSVS
jgi:hypothetical protein